MAIFENIKFTLDFNKKKQETLEMFANKFIFLYAENLHENFVICENI